MVNAGRFIRGIFPAPGDRPDWINCPPLTSPAIPVLYGPKTRTTSVVAEVRQTAFEVAMRAFQHAEHNRYLLQKEVAPLPRAQSVATIALLSALSWGLVISLVFGIAHSL